MCFLDLLYLKVQENVNKKERGNKLMITRLSL